MKKIILRLLLILFIVSIVATGFAIYFYIKFSSLKKTVQSEADVKELISEVGKLVLLPQNEEPTVATITDPKMLKDQTFFRNAKTGDRILIYSVAKKAFLYDPVAKKIIDVAPLFDNAGN